MKKVAKRILTLIVGFCMACVGLVCTPITGVKAADVKGSYVKVTSAPSDWSGDYLIVYESGKVAFNGGLTTLDAVKNTISVTISNNEIEANATTNAAKFTISKSGSNYTVKSASGYYVGQSSNANGLKSSKTTTYAHTISLNGDGTVHMVSGGAYLRYNAASDQCRFRYYKSGSYTSQKAICLYKFVEAASGDDGSEAIVSALDNVNAYMSLAYQYTVSNQIVETTGGTDMVDLNFIGITAYSSYTSWEGREAASGAVYAGQNHKNNGAIQLRSEAPSGIVTTQSAGKVTKISVVWNTNTSTGRTLNVYGKKTAYLNASDLYDTSTAGDLIGTIKNGTSTELTISGDYEYIGLRSAGNAMYLNSVSVEWNGGESGARVEQVFSDAQFKIRCAVDASLFDIDGVDEAGIYVATDSREVYYNEGNSNSWTVDGDMAYVVINLGDVLTETDRVKTKFTVKAYVKIGDNEYTSDLYKAYSVADMVNTYYKSAEISEELKGQLEHLYNYLNPNS